MTKPLVPSNPENRAHRAKLFFGQNAIKIAMPFELSQNGKTYYIYIEEGHDFLLRGDKIANSDDVFKDIIAAINLEAKAIFQPQEDCSLELKSQSLPESSYELPKGECQQYGRTNVYQLGDGSFFARKNLKKALTREDLFEKYKDKITPEFKKILEHFPASNQIDILRAAIPPSEDIEIVEGETMPDLTKELAMQSLLAKDKKLKSSLPKPAGVGKGYIDFIAPKGYYEYLSEIKDTKIFAESACKAAYDLGYLLTKHGFVFPNLISVFHAKDRPYTLLPNLFGANNVNFGGLPGKIGGIVGKALYENIGKSGLRDVGDMQHILEYKVTKEGEDLALDEPSKVAHFISLYLMVFTILLGNRSRILEESAEDVLTWKDNDLIFSQILKSMFEGLGVELQEADLAYIDPSLYDEGKDKMQPAEKFNSQLRFSFTKYKDEIFPEGIYDESGNLKPEAVRIIQEQCYGTNKAHISVISELEGSDVVIADLRNQFIYSSESDFSSADDPSSSGKGWLGCFSGINPLVTACKYCLRASQIALVGMYGIEKFRPQASLEKIPEAITEGPKAGKILQALSRFTSQ